MPVADDHVATIVTTLEMTQRPPLRPTPPSHLRLVRWSKATPEAYRTLFRRAGGPWLWYSRLTMADDALLAVIHNAAVELFAIADPAGIEVGMVELDFRHAGACEISYFALIPELTGRGQGRWLMAETLNLAWRKGIDRVWVNTCTLDHPSALGFYRAQGFVAIRRTVETFLDPRLAGLLPLDAAPHVPVLEKRR